MVELFTAQGCETCVPADETLSALAEREDVLVLSMHIDYWDYRGWEDPFASSLHTERQRAYQRRLKSRFIYTPQIVIDGQEEVLGSQKDEAFAAVERTRGEPKIVQPELIMNDDGTATLIVPQVEDFRGEATIWVALFDYDQETFVKAGENAGRTLHNFNVVRDLMNLGTWTGERTEIPLDMEIAIAKGREGCAILIQREGHGPIVGAVAEALPSA